MHDDYRSCCCTGWRYGWTKPQFTPRVTKAVTYEVSVADLRKVLGITEPGTLDITVKDSTVTVAVR